MSKMLILLTPCSHYIVESEGKTITMISTSMLAEPIAHDVVTVKNVPELVAEVKKRYDAAVSQNPYRSFSVYTRAYGRGPNGYKARKHEINLTYLANA
jgi:hypothetical protein